MDEKQLDEFFKRPRRQANDSSWKGPVFAALILVVGYVGYQQWHEHHLHEQECADLKRAFSSNVNSMADSAPVREALKEKSQAPMIGLSGNLAANQVVMDTLNAKCPGWMQKQYD